MKFFLLLCLVVVCSIGLCLGKDTPEIEDEDFKLKGPNVCVDQREEQKTINITYLQSQDVKEYTWCLKVPPR